MSKKKLDKLAHEREAFIYGDESRNIDGCVKRGIDADIANKLFSQMEEFAKYAFNKSHATAYALNAFITAWLKYYYPSEFFAAAMNWADNEKIKGLMNEARICNAKAKCPHINYSKAKFSIQNNEIYFGLGAIKGIKNNAQKIIEEREKGPYTSLKDFIVRTNISTKNLLLLIDAGAFDDFSSNRAAMKLNIKYLKDTNKKIVAYKDKISTMEFILKNFDKLRTDEDIVKIQEDNGYNVYCKKITKKETFENRLEKAKQSYLLYEEEFNSITIPDIEEDKIKRLNNEKELLGIYVTEHPIDIYPEQPEIEPISETNNYSKSIFGVVENFEIKNRKSDGAEMSIFDITDHTGAIKALCFVDDFKRLKMKLSESDGKAFVFVGKVSVEKIGIDDSGNDITEKKFFVKDIVNVAPIKPAFYMAVSSYPMFHITEESDFRKKYEDTEGHPLYIYDEMMDEMRLATYKISESALHSGCVIK